MKRILLLFLITTVYATNGYLQIGYGVKSKGMGGVGVALPQDAFASAMNPAGIVELGNRFDVGILWLQLDGKYKVGPDPSHGVFTDIWRSEENMYWPEAGIVWKFCPTMAVGIATYAVGGFVTRYPKNKNHERELHADFQIYNITPSWAWQVSRCHQIGVAVNVAYACFDTRALPVDEFGNDSVAPSYVTDKANDYEQGLGFRIGWIGQLCPDFAVGVTYQSKTWMSHFLRYRGFFADDGNFDLPSQWGFGFRYYPLSCLLLAIDVVRINWTDVKMFKHDQLRQHPYGSRNGKGFGWTDEWVVKVGLAWSPIPCFTLRAGWNYGDQLFGGPENKVNRLTLADVEHFWTVGATYQFAMCNEVSINYIHGHNHTQEYLDVNNPEASNITKARQHSIGISYGRRF